MNELTFFFKDKQAFEDRKQDLLDYIGQSPKGVDVVIKEHKTRRTDRQNSFYWANIADLADFLSLAGMSFTVEGRTYPYDKDILHAMTKARLGTNSFANKSTKEFCDIMEQCFDYWTNELTNGFWAPLESTYSYLERTGLLNETRD